MTKKKSKRQALAGGDVPPPRPRRASWLVYAVVGGVALIWVVVLASWVMGLL